MNLYLFTAMCSYIQNVHILIHKYPSKMFDMVQNTPLMLCNQFEMKEYQTRGSVYLRSINKKLTLNLTITFTPS